MGLRPQPTGSTQRSSCRALLRSSDSDSPGHVSGKPAGACKAPGPAGEGPPSCCAATPPAWGCGAEGREAEAGRAAPASTPSLSAGPRRAERPPRPPPGTKESKRGEREAVEGEKLQRASAREARGLRGRQRTPHTHRGMGPPPPPVPARLPAKLFPRPAAPCPPPRPRTIPEGPSGHSYFQPQSHCPTRRGGECGREGQLRPRSPRPRRGASGPAPVRPRAPRPQRGRGGWTATGLPQRCRAGACAGAGGAPRGWGLQAVWAGRAQPLPGRVRPPPGAVLTVPSCQLSLSVSTASSGSPSCRPRRPGRRQGGRPALPAHASRGVLGGAGAFFGPVGLGAPEPTVARGPLDSERYFGPGVGFPGGRERDARPAGARRAPRARGQPRGAAFSALMSSRASLGGFKAPSITTHPPNHLQEALGSRSLSRA